MNNTPLLSIVIPTRNREFYCIQAIKHILSFENQEFELVIQDNSDSKQIFDFINTIQDSRLKYFYTENQLNSLFNMDLAISRANGQYITMIGDDDTVLSTIFKVVEYAFKNNYDAISQKNVVSYNWPNSLGEEVAGELSYKKITYQKVNPNINENINLLLKNGMIDYLSFSFPKVYHGIVLRQRLVEIKKQAGNFFGGLSPDIYSAVSLSFFVKNFIVIDYPYTIAGACQSSTTSQNLSGGHRGELNKAPHLNLRGNYIWDKRIPAYYSVESIWAESAVKSFLENDKEFILKKFNFSYFVLFALWRGKGIRKLILRETFKSRKDVISKAFFFFKLIVSTIPFLGSKFLKYFGKNKKDYFIKVKGVNHIENAVNKVMELLSKEFPFQS